MMRKNNFILTALSVIAGLMFYVTPSEAVHKGAGGLTCGQCHTMHNSQGRASLNTNAGTDDTAMILLRGNVTGRENIHNLCLQCHGVGGVQAEIVQNGSNVVAPKVYLNNVGSYTENDGFLTIGSGGDFSGVGSFNITGFALNAGDGGTNCSENPSLGKGHSLGCKAVPPGADSAVPLDLSCTACHDPHGADSNSEPGINFFRNLRKQPIGGGGGRLVDATGEVTVNVKSWVGGVTGKAGATGAKYQGPVVSGNHIWPIYIDDANQNAYAAPAGEATAAVNGIGSWCAQCHDKWHEAIITDNRTPIDPTYADRRDWKRHPVDNPLVGDGTGNSSAGVQIIKFSHYSNNTLIPVGKKLPVAQAVADPTAPLAAAETYYANSTDGTGEKVFCFSCHFVHGSPYNDILRWNYTESVGIDSVTGLASQKGNAIESNIGCQQCHNR